MLSLSTAYNFAKARWRPLLRRFDHAGIFIMIAASYTPFTTQNLTGWWAIGMTSAVWTVATIGVLAKLLLPGLDKRFWVGLYLALGLAGAGGHQADDQRHVLGGPAAAGHRRSGLFDRNDFLFDASSEVPPRHLARPRYRRRGPALRRRAGWGGPGRRTARESDLNKTPDSKISVQIQALFRDRKMPDPLRGKRLSAPPADVLAEAVGFPGVRLTVDQADLALTAVANRLAPLRSLLGRDDFNILALSGGASGGAFGAGVLVGLTKAGTRPEFAIVTGVSTGALIAPLAFVGAEWDERLMDAYVGGHAAELLSLKPLRGRPGPQPVQGRGLDALVEPFIDEVMVNAVAREHARGRRLLIATTNLDSQKATIWDMGAIASMAARRPCAVPRRADGLGHGAGPVPAQAVRRRGRRRDAIRRCTWTAASPRRCS
jgi:hypothetical protein